MINRMLTQFVFRTYVGWEFHFTGIRSAVWPLLSSRCATESKWNSQPLSRKQTGSTFCCSSTINTCCQRLQSTIVRTNGTDLWAESTIDLSAVLAVQRLLIHLKGMRRRQWLFGIVFIVSLMVTWVSSVILILRNSQILANYAGLF